MARDGNATRERILQEAYRCFYREGFARVSVDTIAAAAKVTKKTLYYHFASKDELVGAVLERQGDYALSMVDSALTVTEREPAKAIREIFVQLAKWAARPRWHGAGFTRIAMELADLPGHPARVATRRHKQGLETMVAARLAERGVIQAEAIARQIVTLLEGAMVLMLVHGDRRYADSAADAAELVLHSADKQRPRPRKRHV
jgi:AcrR family transcriptional regulator